MKLTNRFLFPLVTSAFLGIVSATVASPVYFPVFDPFADATASGGTSYSAGATLAGQTNALGSFWYGIDTGGTAANSAFLSNTIISYPGVTPGPGGNALVLRNVAGPGARIFTGTNSAAFFGGSTTNHFSLYYSMVLQVSNLNNLSAVGGVYAMGFGDQSVIGPQGSQPGTVGCRLYFKKNGTGYQLGISKIGNATNYSPTIFATNDTVFVVADYEGTSTAGSGDLARLWIDPDASTFGAATQPTETINDTAGNNLTPFTSCFQFYNLTTTNANALLITDFRMGTNWSWVTGGPTISQQPPAIANIGGGVLNLTVSAMNNGSTNSFQWQFNGNNLSDGASISGSGATVSGSQTATLTITNTTGLDAGNYTVIVSNSIGSVTSAVSAASAFTLPVITVQPSPTNVNFYAGGANNLNLSFTVQGLPTIQNYLFSNNILVAVVTNQSFALNNLQASANFFAVASNAFGTATSSVVSVTVSPAPTAPYPVAVLADHPAAFFPLSETPDDTQGNQGKAAFDYIAANNGFYSNVDLAQPGYAAGLATEFGYSPATDSSFSALFGIFANPDSLVAQIPNINFGTTGTASSFSVEAWVNANGAGQISGAGIINKGFGGGGEQFNLDFFNNGGNPTWRFYVRNASGTISTASITNAIDGNWHHLVGVLDAAHNSVSIYFDGNPQSTAFIASSGILGSASPVVIGSRMSSSSSDYNNNFSGNIQNVAIYNTALTSAQVLNHYYAAGIGPTAALPSSVVVEEGNTLTVPATATGTPALSYQWFDISSGTPGTALPGQTNASLSIPNISAANFNNHTLDVTVTNIYGQATSASMFVTVDSGPPTSLSVSPQSITLYAGLPAAFTVAGTGSQPFTYQWSTNGVNIAGATDSTFTTTVQVGGPITVGCSVSNQQGIGSPDPATASLTGVARPADIYGQRVLADAPEAFWRFDEPLNASVANDYIGGHDAIYSNVTNGLPGFNPVLYPGETAAGIGMNGITSGTDAVEINNTGSGIPFIDFGTTGSAEFSVETWVQTTPQNADIIAKGFPNNTQFALDTGGTGGSFRFVVHNSANTIFTVNSGSVAPDGNWHHIVGVCDQANNSIYIYADGVRKNTTALSAGTGLLSLANNLFPVVIGGEESASTFSITSMTNLALSQMAIYPYAMSSNQVAAHFAIGVAGIVSLTIQPSTNDTALITWPATNGYFLQQISALGATNWTAVNTPVTIVGNSSQVQVAATNAARFYRLAPQ